MARIRGYIATTIDGFIAEPDGGIGFLEAYPAEDADYERFYAEIATIVMGRQLGVIDLTTGTVKLRLYKGGMQVIGRQSPWALYSEELASFDTTTFDQTESTGAVKNSDGSETSW